MQPSTGLLHGQPHACIATSSVLMDGRVIRAHTTKKVCPQGGTVLVRAFSHLAQSGAACLSCPSEQACSALAVSRPGQMACLITPKESRGKNVEEERMLRKTVLRQRRSNPRNLEQVTYLVLFYTSSYTSVLEPCLELPFCITSQFSLTSLMIIFNNSASICLGFLHSL